MGGEKINKDLKLSLVHPQFNLSYFILSRKYSKKKKRKNCQ